MVGLHHLGRFSNDLWRVDLDDGSRWAAKIPFRPPRPGESFGREAAFYARMAAYRELPILECLNPLDAASPGLVFPYHEFEPFSFFDGATGRHATAAIDALAAWHAAFWRTSLDGFTDYAEVAVRQTIEARYDAAWAAERDRLLEWCPEFASLGDMLVGRLARTLEPMAEPRTLIHSDPHAENVPLSRDSAFLIDWEEPAFANPGLDLAVFMTMSFKEADRGRIERGLVERHAAHVRKQGCEWPAPWRDYRLGLLRRVARIVEVAEVGFGSLPWVFRRSAIAALAHRADQLIR